ncbi:MAG TPA: glycosyltransferase family 4 protein [Acidisarcina sp.]|nr:glycosyltransferase family 4 protein [Acidisarcina sp.]
MTGEGTKVYIQTPKWFLRPRNTDWRYTRFSIPRIHEFEPDCTFYPAQSNATTFHVNARYARHVLYRKLRLPFAEDPHSVLDQKEFARSGSHVVFCHDDFPRNASGIPVVWQNSILDPAMTLARGVSQNELDIEYEVKKGGFHEAAAVQVSTEAERERLGQWFPEIADKFVAVPFFLPNVKTIDPSRMQEKIERSGPLRCLFVGHEAQRKGLGRVYAAMEGLPLSIQKQIHLTVISAQTDGTIAAPSLPNLHVAGAVTHAQVLELMRDSDVFLMPSYFESYGLVYLEAMAQGTIPVVPDWEVQREIVDYGRAGIVTSGDAADLAASLEHLCDDATLRTRLAASALQRFEQHLAPAVVAKKYSSLFHRTALQRGNPESSIPA